MTDQPGVVGGLEVVLDPAQATARRILGRDRALLDVATQLASMTQSGSELDLTMRQLFVLNLLSAEPRSIGEVATALRVTISSASGLVDRLVRARLVARHRAAPPADRRRVMCELTDTGAAALHDHLQVGNLRLQLLLDELSAGELDIVERGLDLLVGAARAVVARSRPASGLADELASG